MPQQPPNSQLLPNFSAAQRARLAQLLKELKCPDCKAYALYLLEDARGATVRCRKCAFAEPLARFAVNRLNYRVVEGRHEVSYTDHFGDLKVVDLGS